ncbi:MAG: tetratricopeptide repeat protein [Bryobacteraceae bacterium]
MNRDCTSRYAVGVQAVAGAHWQEARRAFEACLLQDPGHRGARIHYPLTLLELGETEQALDEGLRSLDFVRESPLLHCTVGRAWAEFGQAENATEAFRESLRLDPTSVQTLDAASRFLIEIDQEAMAISTSSRLAELCPEQAAAWSRLAAARMRAGQTPEAIAAFRTALRIDPTDGQLHSICLHTLLMDPKQSPESLLDEHRRWPFESADLQLYANTPSRTRRLRVGILSGEFAFGSARFFLPPLLRHRSRKQIKLFAYGSQPESDAITELYCELVDQWLDVSTLDDADIARAIQQDKIDILLDISGHLPHRRLGVFARKPAPVQISYPRYPATTGLDQIDYRLTDQWADPPGQTERHYCETLLRVPSGYLVYEPPPDAPPVSPPPCITEGHVTFGFFQSPLKMNEGVFDALAGTLRASVGSRLLIHYAVTGFDQPGSGVRARVVGALTARGVSPDRVEFVGPLSLPRHLALMSKIDIALDAFPYSGQTTTCECLWMGVPVVTLAGDRFASRVSAAILHRAGLDEWVVNSIEQYAETASAMAASAGDLASLRSRLRTQIAESTVCDGRRVMKEIESAFRWAWIEWCDKQASKDRARYSVEQEMSS